METKDLIKWALIGWGCYWVFTRVRIASRKKYLEERLGKDFALMSDSEVNDLYLFYVHFADKGVLAEGPLRRRVESIQAKYDIFNTRE
jgi:hypothetical protein